MLSGRAPLLTPCTMQWASFHPLCPRFSLTIWPRFLWIQHSYGCVSNGGELFSESGPTSCSICIDTASSTAVVVNCIPSGVSPPSHIGDSARNSRTLRRAPESSIRSESGGGGLNRTRGCREAICGSNLAARICRDIAAFWWRLRGWDR